jgi:hypothetical protein
MFICLCVFRYVWAYVYVLVNIWKKLKIKTFKKLENIKNFKKLKKSFLDP